MVVGKKIYTISIIILSIIMLASFAFSAPFTSLNVPNPGEQADRVAVSIDGTTVTTLHDAINAHEILVENNSQILANEEIVFSANTMGIGKNSNTLSVWAPSSFSFRTGSTSPSSGTQRFFVDSTGATATAFFYTSDARLKENIETINDATDIVADIRGVTFDWIASGEEDVGVIAQEVEAVYPYAVRTDNETGMKSVDYPRLIPLLLQAINEQQAEIDALKKQLAQ